MTVRTTSLEEAETVVDPSESLDEKLEREQREHTVHLAIQALPDNLRMVTALYYIGGISQSGIADYLALSRATVKKRLFDARKHLKEDIPSMAEAISQERTPAEEVSARVIAELVSRPQPLLIPDHPLRQIIEQIRDILPNYEMIQTSEVEEKEIYPSIHDTYFSEINKTYQLDSKHILRTETSGGTLRAIKNKKAPIYLLTAGRVFRMETEDEGHLKVFHQLDGICVSQNASIDELRDTLGKVINTILGQVQIRFREVDYGWIDQGMDIDIKTGGKWVNIAGCGMLKPKMLKEAGYYPEREKGYAFGFGLERLTVMKLGLKSVHDLWRSPYLQPSV
jgi:phenylalanyl-tRNA synthetase alpha subunit